MARSKVKSKLHHDVAHLYPLTNVPTKYQLPTPLRFPRYSSDKILKLKVITARPKVKSRSDILTNVPTKYQLPTPYGFGDTARTNF